MCICTSTPSVFFKRRFAILHDTLFPVFWKILKFPYFTSLCRNSVSINMDRGASYLKGDIWYMRHKNILYTFLYRHFRNFLNISCACHVSGGTNYVALVAGIICIAGLLLPTEGEQSNRVPDYLHLSMNFKLIFSFVLGKHTIYIWWIITNEIILFCYRYGGNCNFKDIILGFVHAKDNVVHTS